MKYQKEPLPDPIIYAVFGGLFVGYLVFELWSALIG